MSQDTLKLNKSEIEPAVPAVVLQDILNSFSSETVIIKMDIDGFECKVNKCSIETTQSLFWFSIAEPQWMSYYLSPNQIISNRKIEIPTKIKQVNSNNLITTKPFFCSSDLSVYLLVFQAFQKHILLGNSGKIIPIIFIEWVVVSR